MDIDGRTLYILTGAAIAVAGNIVLLVLTTMDRRKKPVVPATIMTDEVTKVSVNLPSELVEQIKVLAAKRRTTVTEVFCSALSTAKYLSERVDEGAKILLEDKDKSIKQLVFTCWGQMKE